MLGKIAPIAKNATGKVSLGMSFTSLLKSDMTPVMNSISGDGRLASDRIGIKGGKTFTAIGQALKTDALNDIVLNNVVDEVVFLVSRRKLDEMEDLFLFLNFLSSKRQVHAELPL